MKNISIRPRLPLCGEDSVHAENLSANQCGGEPHACLVPSKAGEPSGFEPSGGAVPSGAFNRDYPPLSFVAVAKRAFTGTTQSRQLSGDADYLHWSGPMADSDVQTLRGDIRSMYLHLGDLALGAGYYIQPVMAWYKILDAEGSVLYRSVPVIVGTGLQGAEAFMSDVVRGGSVTATGFKMSLEGFRLGFIVPDAGGDYSDAVALEIMVTPMLNMLSLAADADVSMGRNDGAETVIARMAKLAEAPLMVASVLDRLDEVSNVAVRIVRPFAGGITGVPGSVVAVSVIRESGVARESDVLLKRLRGKVRSVNRFIAESTVPHGFNADVAVRIGDMMVYGAVCPLHRRPPRLSDIAVGCVPSSAYTALVRVTSVGADGAEEVLSTSDGRLSMAPEELSPLIAYPLPNAVRMEIQVSTADGGVRRVIDLPLRPTPDGTMSYYLAPDLKPVAVESGVMVSVPLLPVDSPFGAKRGGLLAVSSIDEPFALRSCIDICGGDIVAVTSASRSSSAWDFARRHLYLFSTSGVYSAAVNASCTLTSAHLISPLPVVEPAHASYSPEGVYFLSGGSLFRVAGSRIEAVMPDIGAEALAWSLEHGWLWCRMTDGAYLAVTADGRWSAVQPEHAGHIRWRRRLALDGMSPAPLRRLRWLMSGSDVSLDVAVRGDNGCGQNAVDLLALHVAGSICSPVKSAVWARPFRYLTVEVSGTVAGDFRLGELLLGFDER